MERDSADAMAGFEDGRGGLARGDVPDGDFTAEVPFIPEGGEEGMVRGQFGAVDGDPQVAAEGLMARVIETPDPPVALLPEDMEVALAGEEGPGRAGQFAEQAGTGVGAGEVGDPDPARGLKAVLGRGLDGDEAGAGGIEQELADGPRMSESGRKAGAGIGIPDRGEAGRSGSREAHAIEGNGPGGERFLQFEGRDWAGVGREVEDADGIVHDGDGTSSVREKADLEMVVLAPGGMSDGFGDEGDPGGVPEPEVPVETAGEDVAPVRGEVAAGDGMGVGKDHGETGGAMDVADLDTGFATGRGGDEEGAVLGESGPHDDIVVAPGWTDGFEGGEYEKMDVAQAGNEEEGVAWVEFEEADGGFGGGGLGDEPGIVNIPDLEEGRMFGGGLNGGRQESAAAAEGQMMHPGRGREEDGGGIGIKAPDQMDRALSVGRGVPVTVGAGGDGEGGGRGEARIAMAALIIPVPDMERLAVGMGVEFAAIGCEPDDVEGGIQLPRGAGGKAVIDAPDLDRTVIGAPGDPFARGIDGEEEGLIAHAPFLRLAGHGAEDAGDAAAMDLLADGTSGFLAEGHDELLEGTGEVAVFHEADAVGDLEADGGFLGDALGGGGEGLFLHGAPGEPRHEADDDGGDGGGADGALPVGAALAAGQFPAAFREASEPDGEFAGGAEAGVRIGGEAGEQVVEEEGVADAAGDVDGDGLRQVSDKDLVQENAEGVDVGGRGRGGAAKEFRGPAEGGAGGVVGGDGIGCEFGCKFSGELGGDQGTGAEVRDLDGRGGGGVGGVFDHDHLGLEVAVDDACSVGCIEGLGGLCHDFEGILGRSPAGGNGAVIVFPEGGAAGVFGFEVMGGVVELVAVEARDSRVMALGAAEALEKWAGVAEQAHAGGAETEAEGAGGLAGGVRGKPDLAEVGAAEESFHEPWGARHFLADGRTPAQQDVVVGTVFGGTTRGLEGCIVLLTDLEDGYGGFKSLEVVLAVTEPTQGSELGQITLVGRGTRQVEGGLGEENLVGTREVHDAEGKADREPGEVLRAVRTAAFLNLIEVDADAVGDAEVGGLPGKPGAEFALEAKRESKGLARMGKGEEHRVAPRIDDLTSADALEDSGGKLVVLEDPAVALEIAEGGKETGRADDVREDQRLPSSHGIPRRVRFCRQAGRVHRRTRMVRCAGGYGKSGARPRISVCASPNEDRIGRRTFQCRDRPDEPAPR